MAQFSLPNIQTGGSQTITANTLADAQAQAQSAGTWNPGAGTYGANSILGGGGGGGASVYDTTGAGGGGVTSPLAGLQAFAAQTSGVTQAQLAQQKQEFDAQLQFAKDQMTQLGIPQLQINQFLAQMQQEQFQSQLQLATQAQSYNQAATTAGMTGYYTPPGPVPSMTQYTGQNIWQPGQQGFGGSISQGGGALTWDRLSQMMKAAAPNNYNDAAAKALAFQMQGSQQGSLPLNLSQAQLDQIVATGTGGQIPSFATISGQPNLWSAGGGGGGNQPGGTGYFVGNDGRIHVGSPSGTGQAGWGGGSGTQAASGWAPGTQSSNPNIFLQPPSQNAPMMSQSAPTTGGGGATGSTGTGASTMFGGPSTVGPGFVPWQGGQGNGLFGERGATGGGGGQPGQPPGSQMTMQLGQLLGQYNGMPTEQATEFARNLSLQQGQLGQQYLSTAAQLQGPQNTFQLSNYLRGAQGNASVPTYLQNLASNIGMPMFQAPGSTAPTPQSAAGLASQLGGQTSATPGWNYNQTLGTIQNIMNQGAQRLGPGALESLSPEELQAFGSGLGAAGGSLPAFMQAYQTSRVGQQAPIAQTRLA